MWVDEMTRNIKDFDHAFVGGWIHKSKASDSGGGGEHSSKLEAHVSS